MLKIISFFIIFFSIKICKAYVIINLKKFGKNTEDISSNYSPEMLIENLYTKYYGLLNIGYPPQKTELQFSLNDYSISMQENICYTSYYFNKNKSLTLSQTDKYNIDTSNKIIFVKDSIEFPVFDIDTKILSYKPIQDYIFIYNKENKTNENLDKDIEAKACLIYGFKISKNNAIYYNINNVIENLRKNGLTKTENFNFEYYSIEEQEKNGGYCASIIIGEQPHVYSRDKYKEENYALTNAVKMIDELGWIFEFKNYYYLNNGTKIEFKMLMNDYKLKGRLVFDLDIIIGIREYLTSIKNNYFNKYGNQCQLNEINLNNNLFTVFTCDKNFDTKDFPTLYFENSDYNYTFELTHEDLFAIKGDKKYFLIVFDKKSLYPWKLGKIFMKKYFFNFEYDSRKIGFYVDKKISNENNNNSYTWKIIIGCLIVVFVGVIGFIIGINIKKRNRKKRANELDDEYEYYYDYKDKNKNQKEDSISHLNKEENDLLGIN